ncbi:MAG TPA: NB-ARC domain-containing protein [Anaerolineales bacterium]
MSLGEKLGKLSIAILENFVEDKLGKKFVDELRAPTDRAIAVATALEETENRFKKEFDDPEIAHAMFVDLPADKEILGAAVGKFYDHPTDPDFQQNLEKILAGAFKNISKQRVKKAVDFYIEILTEELALADETFRENARALSDLRVVQILKRVEQHLANQNSVNQEHLVLRALHQLPPAPADFTGREEQLKQVLDALKEHKGAAISGLTGMGGIGKTALGLVAAHQIESQYPNAQIFLDLKGVTEPLSASDALRHVILSFEPKADLREANEDQLAALYQSLLADKKILVFMDNARDAAQVRSLIPPESCTLIVTSRWHFILPNMNPLRLDVLLPENQAIDLLHELCKRIGGTAKDIAESCGYLPLALRIAGTFLAEHNDWNPREYAERLKAKCLSALKGEEQDERFDLENVLGESYGQLTQDEQKYWRMLAVFPASFKREAAAVVWKLDEDAARDLLSKFNRMNLLDYDEKARRYSLHDLLGEFARSKLSDEESFSARLEHAKYYYGLMKYADNLFSKGGKDTLSGLFIFDTDWVNIEAARRWTVSKMNNSEDAASLCNYTMFIYCLDLRLHPLKKISWLNASLEASRLLKDKEGEGIHLGNLGKTYAELSEVRKAIEFYEQALAIDREIGNRRGEGAGLGSLGYI